MEAPVTTTEGPITETESDAVKQPESIMIPMLKIPDQPIIAQPPTPTVKEKTAEDSFLTKQHQIIDTSTRKLISKQTNIHQAKAIC